MQMTDVRDKLQSLQKVLSEKYSIEKEVGEAPGKLNDQEELLSKLKKEYLETDASAQATKERVLQLEVELTEVVKLKEDGEKGMDNITTNREYEALDKQIQEASAKEKEVRKELDKQKKIYNDLNDKIKSDLQMIESQESSLKDQRAVIDKQSSKLKNQLEKLEKKEAELTEGLDTEIVYKFQRIIQRNSEGIVAVKNGVCEGCHMILPAQFANEVHDGDKTLFCPYCSRILFYQESDENEQDYYGMAEAGSLADFDDFGDDSGDSESEDYGDEENFRKKSSEYDEDVEDEEEEDEEKEEESEEDDSDEN